MEIQQNKGVKKDMDEKEIVYCKYKEECRLSKSDLCIIKGIELNKTFKGCYIDPECMLHEARRANEADFKRLADGIGTIF